MGWNEVVCNNNHKVFRGYADVPRFYFVHSYHVCCRNPTNAIATTSHGYDFTSCIMQENVLGVQFHPEKSHRYGLKFLSNFVVADDRTVSADSAID